MPKSYNLWAFLVHTQNANGIYTYRNKVIRSQIIKLQYSKNQENLQLHHKVSNVMVKLPKSASCITKSTNTKFWLMPSRNRLDFSHMHHEIDENKIILRQFQTYHHQLLCLGSFDS